MKNSPADNLLLVLPILAFRSGGRIFIDKQARNGLRLWLENFDSVTLACLATDREPPTIFAPIDELNRFDQLRFVVMPDAYGPWRFLKTFLHTARLLSSLIDQSEHLHFAIGGLWGDWASAAAIVATMKRRSFAVWTDRVESKVTSFDARSKTGLRRLYMTLVAGLMHHYERFIIRLSSLGLFHGMDCFEAYAPFDNNPHLVHDIHLSPDAGLSSDELNARRAASTGILRVVYAGRAHREKGIFDWIETLKLAHDEGVKFDATWFGDGPDLDAAIAAAKDLPGCIHFPGSVANHQELISKLKQFDLFLFCHKTPESPRCLVEALVCGLPLLGYDSPYPRDLISVHGGGVLTAPHRPSDLANILAGFPSNSRDLTERAIKDGADFNDESVFRHRSDLMRSIHKSYVERMSRVPQPHGNQ